MRAVVYQRLGGPEVLELRDWPRPEPKRGEVVVAVHAVGVNPVDAQNLSGGDMRAHVPVSGRVVNSHRKSKAAPRAAGAEWRPKPRRSGGTGTSVVPK
jgi:NADPH:quinone reductase-like Zn-dependent oxidoreductase